MHRKNILFVTNELSMPAACRHALSNMDVQIVAATFSNYHEAFSRNSPDLLIADLSHGKTHAIPKLETYLFENGPVALFVIADADGLAELRMPVRIASDFVVHHATEEEYAARIRQLLWPGEESSASDLVRIDTLIINLATYQVSISGEPIDFTYLEYALLSFLATHPGRTYSRDVLLRRVWGFEYTGSSRTVDVHVRRIRAKLGPEYAQRLETVRGVGYFWTA